MEVWREFQAGDLALVITYYDDRLGWIERDVSQLGLHFGPHLLLADGLIFVDVEVKNVNLKEKNNNNKNNSCFGPTTGIDISVYLHKVRV